MENDVLKKEIVDEKEARAKANMDVRFDVNKDIFKVRMMDADEITTAKADKKMTIVEDVIDDDAPGEETARVSPSIFVDPLKEDEEIFDPEDGVD
ncbi:uncharacterized protein HKW66_Vig0104370 [Vigna angularis]|uniref:Uncharacterized protein n=1 Tax=Phaseolus angularis TaxID=3914 RepID=A0A8T0KI81_PHAAN|nr:uncharacterized protein HKW66_Vig0104370 [Vigna angularis]